jgi:hypothetical protein
MPLRDFCIGIEAGHLPERIMSEEDLMIIRENNLNWLGVDFIWRRIEPSEGKFNFLYYDWLTEKADEFGLKILGRLANGYDSNRGERNLVPEWIKVESDDYANKVSNYASEVIWRYGEKIKYWVLENEGNNIPLHKLVGWRQIHWTMDKLKEVLQEGSTAIRDVDSSVKIGISVCTDVPGWKNYLERVVSEWKISFDFVGLQSYPFALLELGRFGKLSRYMDISRLGDRVINSMIYSCKSAMEVKSEVLFSEIGFHTLNNSDNQQAEALLCLLKGAYESGARGAFWFCYRDDPFDFPDQEKHFGLLLASGGYKQGWEVIKRVASDPTVLAGIKYRRKRKPSLKSKIIDRRLPSTLYSKGIESLASSQKTADKMIRLLKL